MTILVCVCFLAMGHFVTPPYPAADYAYSGSIAFLEVVGATVPRDFPLGIVDLIPVVPLTPGSSVKAVPRAWPP